MAHNGTKHHFEYSNEESVSISIVRALATLTESDPTDLSALHESVPVDALTALVGAGEDVTVMFSYEGRRITIHGDGEFTVHDPK